jgi:hypothetical protein
MTKFILRLLTAADELMGWTEVHAVARGDGCLWLPQDALIPIRTEGTATTLSVHWVDVNCAYRVPFPAAGIARPGDVAQISAEGPIWTVGPAAGGLPPVEVGSTVIGVPVGSFGLRTH